MHGEIFERIFKYFATVTYKNSLYQIGCKNQAHQLSFLSIFILLVFFGLSWQYVNNYRYIYTIVEGKTIVLIIFTFNTHIEY